MLREVLTVIVEWIVAVAFYLMYDGVLLAIAAQITHASWMWIPCGLGAVAMELITMDLFFGTDWGTPRSRHGKHRQ